MKAEKEFLPLSGYVMLAVALLLIIPSIIGLIVLKNLFLIGLVFIGVFILVGFIIVNPNESSIMVLFGAYKGTIKQNGFSWVNPFFTRKKISLRARKLDSAPIKVNDKIGNPIMIGVVMVWKVEDTYKAAFEVDDYVHFVDIQSEAAVRKLAGHFPYDDFEAENAEITLRGGGEEVNQMLEDEITDRKSVV